MLGTEIKGVLDLHSLRANFAQQLYMVKDLKDVELKTLMGHKSNDITDKHYLRGLRDRVSLKEKVDKADFSAFLP